MGNTEQTTIGERFLKLREVLDSVAMSRAAWYRAMEANEAPRPVKLTSSGRSVAWSAREIAAWIEQRLEAREPTRKAG